MPKQTVTVRVCDEAESEASIEERLGKLAVELAPMTERMPGMLVASVARADLPDRLTDRIVTLDVSAGPADVVRPGEGSLLADLPYDITTYGNVVAGDDRNAGSWKIDALVSGARIRLSSCLLYTSDAADDLYTV